VGVLLGNAECLIAGRSGSGSGFEDWPWPWPCVSKHREMSDAKTSIETLFRILVFA